MCEYCKYCEGSVLVDSSSEYAPSDFMSVEHGYVEVGISGNTGWFNVNYCPMCGKKLEEEYNEL